MHRHLLPTILVLLTLSVTLPAVTFYVCLTICALILTFTCFSPQKTYTHSAHRTPEKSADDTLKELGALSLTPEQEVILKRALERTAAQTVDACRTVVTSQPHDAHSALTKHIDLTLLHLTPEGSPYAEQINVDAWAEWYPSPWSQQTLGRLLYKIPPLPNEETPWLMKVLRNHHNTLALRGSCSPSVTNTIHCIMGRGYTHQDRAFILGFITGNLTHVTSPEIIINKQLLHTYQLPHDAQRELVKVYEQGIIVGKNTTNKDIHKLDFVSYLNMTPWQARRRLGINDDELRKAYEWEANYISTPTSMRLKRAIAAY